MSTVTGWQRELVSLINELRAERGLPALTIDANLQDAATWRALDMLRRNYFAYETPPVGPREPARPEGPPSAVVQRFGYVPASHDWTSAESILVGDLNGNGAIAAADVFAALRDSPYDLQNLIGESFAAIGVGGPAGDGDEQPMAGVCVVELGSEVVTPVTEPAQAKFALPRQDPPQPVPQEPRDPAERIAIAAAVGRSMAPMPARMVPSAFGGERWREAAVGVAEAVGEPSGPVKTPAPWGSFNCDWSDINRWNDILRAAADEFGVPFKRLKAHVVIESQGNPEAVQKNDANGWSYGLMQIVPHGVGWEGWHEDVIRLAGQSGNPAKMLINKPDLNVRVGAYILTVQKANYGTWDRASSAFFLGNPDWEGGDPISGATGEKYRKAVKGLMEEMGGGTDTDDGDVEPAAGAGAALVQEALAHVGKPYVHATAGPNTFDCSGLVYYCYTQVTGENLDPSYRDSHKQFLWGDAVDPSRARPGDLVFYDTADGTEWRLGNNASHVGIYGGGNELINALNPDQGVRVSDLSTGYWTSRWIGTRRVLPTG